ncbi:hypothetical protein JJ691_20090 [Kutzneria sp. CA-103260]|nr:hypothetical protein JJ691_20090 [Kutzneria sp. CA-103260]
MARVYVSSTFIDLEEHREAVRTSIRRMGHEDVAMEYYVAEDKRPVDKCLADVRSADLYVVVMAWRYGFVPDGHGASITELEYRAAVEADVPVLAFVLSEEHPWPPKLMEHSPDVVRFRDELLDAHVGGVFTSTDDLARRVSEALHQWGELSAPSVDWGVYRQAIVEHYRWVRLSVIAGAHEKRLARIPLTDVFVPQQVALGRPDYDLPQDLVESSDALHVIGRAARQVVLGGPGSGKSTLFHVTMLALCDPAASEDRVPVFLTGHQVPLLVELRQYVLSGSADFVAYLIDTTMATLGVRLDEDTVVDLLLDGEAVVLFDGLDEIFERSKRGRVVDQFRAFVRRFPRASVVVSSRIVGYDETELGLAGFEHHTLLDFGLREVREFVPRWYEHYTVQGEDRDANGLIRRITDNPRLLELAGNPLLLTMMAVIYKHYDLPERRWQLYARCIGVLLEDWDVKRKKIDTKELLRLDFVVGADQKAEILHRVAVLMLTVDATDGVRELNAIQYKPLRDTVAAYLVSQYDRSSGEGRALATEIVNHLRERTYVLAETGDGVFGFVHRTFMEYFAASQVLAEFNRRKADYRWLTDEVYGRYAHDDRWREPLLLLSGMLAGQGSPIREIVDALERLPNGLVFAGWCLAETGQIRPEDRRWASQLLSRVVAAIRHAEPSHRGIAGDVDRLIAAFSRLVVFTPVSDEVHAQIEMLTDSRSPTERVVGWQLNVAFGSRNERRRTAIAGLEHRDAAIRQAAISVFERDWAGDEDVFRAFLHVLHQDRSTKVREFVLVALHRGWPRRRIVLETLRSRTGRDTSTSHLAWLATHLATHWAGDAVACELVLELTRHPTTDEWSSQRAALRAAVADALVDGWARTEDLWDILNDKAREDDLSVAGTAVRVMLRVNREGTLESLSPFGLRSIKDVLPYVVEGFTRDPHIVGWLLDLAYDVDIKDELARLLVRAATRDPDCELVLHALTSIKQRSTSRALAKEILGAVASRHHRRAAARSKRDEEHWIHAVHAASVLTADAATTYWSKHQHQLAALSNALLSAIRSDDAVALAGLIQLVRSVLKPSLVGTDFQALRTALSRAEEVFAGRANELDVPSPPEGGHRGGTSMRPRKAIP